MNTQATPDSHLLLNVSPATKARVVESLFPNPNACYADEITHKLTRIKRVLGGLSNLGEGDNEQITGQGNRIKQLLEFLVFLLYKRHPTPPSAACS